MEDPRTKPLVDPNAEEISTDEIKSMIEELFEVKGYNLRVLPEPDELAEWLFYEETQEDRLMVARLLFGAASFRPVFECRLRLAIYVMALAAARDCDISSLERSARGLMAKAQFDAVISGQPLETAIAGSGGLEASDFRAIALWFKNHPALQAKLFKNHPALQAKLRDLIEALEEAA